MEQHTSIPALGYGLAFAVLAFGLLALGTATSWWWVERFERFYRYGYLVFGGRLVAVAAVILMKAGDTTPDYALATLATIGLLLTRKIPAPLIVFAALLAGLL